MPTIAPWLQLPNFQAAAEAGARIGLQQKSAADELALNREKLAQQSAQAAGELGLHYSQLGVEGKKAQNEKDLALATLALKGGRYSDLNNQAGDKLDLSRDRFDATQDNRGVVNELNRDKLTSLDTYRGERLAGGAGGVPRGTTGAAPAKDKVFMVPVPIPANAETGEAASVIHLPSTHPAAIAFLKAHNMLSPNAPDENGIYTPTNITHSGDVINDDLRTSPVPVQQGAAGDAQALQPRNQIYMGGNSEPIFDPGTMPPESLSAPTQANPPAANVLDKATAAKFLSNAKGDKAAARKAAREAGYTF